MDIVWKQIGDFINYEVSSTGGVRRADIERCLKPSRTSDGYLCVGLYNRETGQKKSFMVHRLVAAAFLSNEGDRPTVNHLNGVKTDNRVENLEWATNKEQTDHAIQMGMFASKRVPKPFFAESLIDGACIIFPTQVIASAVLGVPQRKISSVLRGEARRYRSWTFSFIENP